MDIPDRQKRYIIERIEEMEDYDTLCFVYYVIREREHDRYGMMPPKK